MDDIAPIREAVTLFASWHRRQRRATHLVDDFVESLLHVLRLPHLVLGECEMKSQYGNPIPVDNIRVDLAVTVVVRNHFAAAGEVDLRRVVPAVIVLQLFAVTAGAVEPLDAAENAVRRHAPAAADLDVVAA